METAPQANILRRTVRAQASQLDTHESPLVHLGSPDLMVNHRRDTSSKVSPILNVHD
jgi:hypothetical protein